MSEAFQITPQEICKSVLYAKRVIDHCNPTLFADANSVTARANASSALSDLIDAFSKHGVSAGMPDSNVEHDPPMGLAITLLGYILKSHRPESVIITAQRLREAAQRKQTRLPRKDRPLMGEQILMFHFLEARSFERLISERNSSFIKPKMQ